MARRYEEELSNEITILPFERFAARAYARIRQDRTIRAADALNLACAAARGVDLFVTNDSRLQTH